MEREPEQAALVVALVELDHPVAHVQERRAELLPVRGHDVDQARLVDDEQPAGVVGRLRERERVREPVGDEVEADGGLGAGGRDRQQGEQEGERRRFMRGEGLE